MKDHLYLSAILGAGVIAHYGIDLIMGIFIVAVLLSELLIFSRQPA